MAVHKVPRTCENCGTIFHRTPSYLKKVTGKFCGTPCYLKNRWRTIEERFWDYVRKTGTCWVWTGTVDYEGYGTISETLQGRQKRHVASRVSYVIHYGPIPDSINVLHRCDNPPCVRPDHLFLGTNADNVADMVAKRRTAYGSKNANAQMTESLVREVRFQYASRKRGDVQRIANEFGIDRTTLHQIVTRQTWKHVE